MNLKKRISAKSIAAVAAGIVVLGGAGYAAADNLKPSEPVITVDGTFKPGAELAVSVQCDNSPAFAAGHTSFGEKFQLYPAADSGQLVGFVTAPVNIGPGPDEGYHTLTVTCEKGVAGTVRFEDAGNGTAKTEFEAH